MTPVGGGERVLRRLLAGVSTRLVALSSPPLDPSRQKYFPLAGGMTRIGHGLP